MATLNNLLAYEKYIPVLTPAELEGLAVARPSLAVLQVWQKRLINHRARLDAVFGRAYEKINKKEEEIWKRKI